MTAAILLATTLAELALLWARHTYTSAPKRTSARMVAQARR
jgi:hypothetical protein